MTKKLVRGSNASGSMAAPLLNAGGVVSIDELALLRSCVYLMQQSDQQIMVLLSPNSPVSGPSILGTLSARDNEKYAGKLQYCYVSEAIDLPIIDSTDERHTEVFTLPTDAEVDEESGTWCPLYRTLGLRAPAGLCAGVIQAMVSGHLLNMRR